MSDNYIRKNYCRICGNTSLVEILDLGAMPPANSFFKVGESPPEMFPLVLYFCQNCFLVQLLDVVSPEILFGHYDYLTSASQPLVDHFRGSVRSLKDRFLKSKDDLVVEIGGNDGVLLSEIVSNCRALNVEPAENVAKLSKSNGIPTLNRFFNNRVAEEILKEYGPANLVVANNVLAHVDDLKGVFEGIKLLLAEDGALVFEVHWVGNLIGEGGFDQIYHEHLCYFSLLALNSLMGRLGLKIFDVDLIPIHGESLRVYVGKNQEISPRVDALLRRERELGLDRVETFISFSDKVRENRAALQKILWELRWSGKKVIGYGAPAKGNTLLNYCGFNQETMDFLTDTTPFKQGLMAPGSAIPVYHPNQLKKSPPDYCLLLAWNYADAIIRKEEDFRKRGGKFIIPVPEVRIV